MPSVLIIDSKPTLAATLARDLVRTIPRALSQRDIAVEADFSKARTRLSRKPPALMVTALQLQEYNGLQLVYLAAEAGLPTRSVVHTEAVDPAQAREVRAAGAFYEVRARLPRMLPAYVLAVLPAEDRRDPMTFERRHLARGGRRAADQQPAI